MDDVVFNSLEKNETPEIGSKFPFVCDDDDDDDDDVVDEPAINLMRKTKVNQMKVVKA